ncbi:hypothetical protein HK105_208280 [Polyrhizophydium stewartii]|uniref:Uncharacterized protein n=1 Tax=Polyrhizophydium stewartii TaxID=2732419 RepID=A0ABR4MY74_9FUNG
MSNDSEAVLGSVAPLVPRLSPPADAPDGDVAAAVAAWRELQALAQQHGVYDVGLAAVKSGLPVALRSCLADSAVAVKLAALECMHELPPMDRIMAKHAIPMDYSDPITHALRSPDVAVRRAAAKTLGVFCKSDRWDGVQPAILVVLKHLASWHEEDLEARDSLVRIAADPRLYHQSNEDLAAVHTSLVEHVKAVPEDAAVHLMDVVKDVSYSLCREETTDPPQAHSVAVQCLRELIKLLSFPNATIAAKSIEAIGYGLTYSLVKGPALSGFISMGGIEAVGAVGSATIAAAVKGAREIIEVCVKREALGVEAAVQSSLFRRIVDCMDSSDGKVAGEAFSMVLFLLLNKPVQAVVDALSTMDIARKMCRVISEVRAEDFALVFKKLVKHRPTIIGEFDSLDAFTLLSQKTENYRGEYYRHIIATYFAHHLTTALTNILEYPANDDVQLHKTVSDIEPVPARTLVELRYMELVGAILSKPSWWTKMSDAAITAKWRAETREQGVSDATFALLLDELAYLARHCVRTACGGSMTVKPGPVELTVMSDNAVSDELRDALVSRAGVLEDVAEHKKDWHPGTGRKVLDLVHPSLFCLVYGRTLVVGSEQRAGAMAMLPADVHIASERVAARPTFEEPPGMVSDQFQWLPSEFRVEDDGSVSILSPINNLHPGHHRALYATIANVFSRFVPLFEDLAAVVDVNLRRAAIEDHMEGYERDYGEEDDDEDEEGEDEEGEDEEDEGQDGDEENNDGAAMDGIANDQPLTKDQTADVAPEDPATNGNADDPMDCSTAAAANIPDGSFSSSDDDAESEASGGVSAHIEPVPRRKPVHVPALPERFQPPASPPARVSLRGRNLQVIVKLANIHLTPESPKYAGGSWHVEGMSNEAIVATGICYYDMDNITPSLLSFREALPEWVAYEQSDWDYCRDVYGIENESTHRNQRLGSIKAAVGRCIVFPNILQHKVQPFELADPTRPGFRKILAFFLVDPAKRTVSTAHLAPQQRDWHDMGLRTTQLPPELWQGIVGHLPGTMSLDDAKRLRQDLMGERTSAQEGMTERMYEETYNLCEH